MRSNIFGKNLICGAFRSLSLLCKLSLTLFLAHYLNINDFGLYGLICAYISIAIPLISFRYDYIVSRDIVDQGPLKIARCFLSQLKFSFICICIFLFFSFIFKKLFLKDLNEILFVVILLICVFENLGLSAWNNLISRRLQISASIELFLRSSSWAIPFIILGFFFTSFRNCETLLKFWLFGAMAGLLFSCFIFRNLPWRAALQESVSICSIINNAWQAKMIWIGSVATAGAAYANRFVVESLLGRESVGIITFFTSFTIAIGALLESGLYTFVRPHLISLYTNGNIHESEQETKKSLKNAFILSGFICVAVGLGVQTYASYALRSEILINLKTFWLMLSGSLIACVSYILYINLYAKRNDKIVALNEILNCILSFGLSYFFVYFFGIDGVGYAMLISAISVFIYRFICVYYLKK